MFERFTEQSAPRRRPVPGRGAAAEPQLHRDRAHPARPARRARVGRRPGPRRLRPHPRRRPRGGRARRSAGARSAPSGHIPFTPRAKKTLELSLREALAIKHNYIGTEHILLGLIREGEGVAAQILRDHADLLEIRLAVLNAVSGRRPGRGDEGEGAEETNAVLRWLRQRLSRHATSLPFRPDVPGAEPATRGTPAVEAALQQAARLAGPLPVGSHHLLLAALEDANSAASWALASLGVDLDELREKLRAAKVTGHQRRAAGAGRAPPDGHRGLRRDAARRADRPGHRRGGQGGPARGQRTGPRRARGTPRRARGGEAGAEEVEARRPRADGGRAARRPRARPRLATVIRGDNPYAVGLADVWLELRKTLHTIATRRSGPPRSRGSP